MLASRDIQIIGPDAGEQACGDVGPGRLLEPEAIVAAVNARFEAGYWKGAGWSHRGPDHRGHRPGSILSNHSSGKWALHWQGLCRGRCAG